MMVDMVPLIGPPAWMVMVFFYVKYDLNIWLVLIIGVTASAAGRYIYSTYVRKLSSRFIKKEKNEDLEFIGSKLSKSAWKIQLFVLIFTLLPLPSTPLFTAAAMARLKVIKILPAFFVGKFISDFLMVKAGHVMVENIQDIINGLLTWKSIAGAAIILVIILAFLFVDWRLLIEKKKLKLSFRIWK